MVSPGCEYSGDSDIYGLGIRLGLYLQWFSFAIATFFRLESTDAAYTAYLAFQVALGTAAFVITFGAQDVGSQPHRAEIAILLFLFYGGNLVFANSGAGPAGGSAYTPGRIQSALNEQVQNLTRILIGAYSIWFWATVNQQDDRFADTLECPSFVFFFDLVTGNVLRGVGILFAILAAWNSIDSLIDLRHGPSRLYAFLSEFFLPLPVEYRKEISDFLNENCSKWIHSQGYNIPDLPDMFWKSLRVEDVTHTYVLLRNDYQTKRFPVSHSTRLSGRIEDDKARLRINLERESKFMLKMYGYQRYDNVSPEDRPHLNELSLSIYQQIIGTANSEEEEDCQSVWEFVHKAFTRKNVHNMRVKWDTPDTASTASGMIRLYMRYAVPTLRQIITVGKLLLSLIICTYTIIAIEIMISGNGISGVGVGTAGSVGQLIPLVFSVLTFIGTFNDVRTKFKKIRVEANVPFKVDDIRLDRLSSPQARSRMQTVDARWH